MAVLSNFIDKKIMDSRSLTGASAVIGITVVDILYRVNTILVLIITLFTIVYIGYGIYKRYLECKKLRNDNERHD